jgi:hypothetical protein
MPHRGKEHKVYSVIRPVSEKELGLIGHPIKCLLMEPPRIQAIALQLVCFNMLLPFGNTCSNSCNTINGRSSWLIVSWLRCRDGPNQGLPWAEAFLLLPSSFLNVHGYWAPTVILLTQDTCHYHPPRRKLPFPEAKPNGTAYG